MTVRWTVRAANDRRASSPRPRPRFPHQEKQSFDCFFFFKATGVEVGAVVNDSPVDCQSRE